MIAVATSSLPAPVPPRQPHEDRRRDGEQGEEHQEQAPPPAQEAPRRQRGDRDDARRSSAAGVIAAPGSRRRSRGPRRSGGARGSRRRRRGRAPGAPGRSRRSPRSARRAGPPSSWTPKTDGWPTRAAASRRSSDERSVNVWGRSVMSRRISRKSPDAARRPLTITRTFWASRSTSSRMCELNRITRPSSAIRAEQLHHVEALARIHPVERLVEEQDRGVVDQGAGDLDPLAHPLGVRADRAVRGVLEADRRDRPAGRAVRDPAGAGAAR